jgi:hypothetical protein
MTDAQLETAERYARVPGAGDPGRLKRRPIAEVYRLRQLAIDAEPHVPDNDQTRTIDLPARLKAEVDRE